MRNDTSSQSLPLSEPPRRVLAEIISQYGPDVCNSPTRIEALLRDMCGEYRREINLLVSALKDKVAADLLSASATPAELLISRLTTRLRDNHSLTEDAARWAVESWALALGRITREQLSASAVVASIIPALPPMLLPPAYTGPPLPYAGPPQHAGLPAGQGVAPYGTPRQMQQPPPLSWPPPVQGGYAVMPNTSGTLGPIPPEIMAMRWSWAGFFWNWLWMCNNGLAGARLLLFISCFIPYVNVISVIYLGINGNQLAWQYRRFESIDHFKRVQSVWAKWALWLFLIGIGFDVLTGIIGALSNNR